MQWNSCLNLMGWIGLLWMVHKFSKISLRLVVLLFDRIEMAFAIQYAVLQRTFLLCNHSSKMNRTIQVIFPLRYPMFTYIEKTIWTGKKGGGRFRNEAHVNDINCVKIMIMRSCTASMNTRSKCIPSQQTYSTR